MEKDITPLNKIWDEVFGPIGCKERKEVDAEAEKFCQCECQKGKETTKL